MLRNRFFNASKFGLGVWLVVAIPSILFGVPRLRLFQVFWATQAIPLLVYFQIEDEPDEEEKLMRVMRQPAYYKSTYIQVLPKEDRN